MGWWERLVLAWERTGEDLLLLSGFACFVGLICCGLVGLLVRSDEWRERKRRPSCPCQVPGCRCR